MEMNASEQKEEKYRAGQEKINKKLDDDDIYDNDI